MKDLTLLVLAAGMGSRFGGLKQIEPVGPNDEFIIDYSVYDAIKAGFNKIVFLIKEENYEIFKNTIGKRVEKHIKVDYVFQKNDNIPEGYEIPKERIKPLGTAHAILCAKDKIKENFAIINADDFYGREAYIEAVKFLNNIDEKTNNYGLIGYMIKNTLTENGAVKRGICDINGTTLNKLIESSVEKVNGKIIASPLDGSSSFEIRDDQIISMNMLLFTPTIFKYIETKFVDFFEENRYNLGESEFLIPIVLYQSIVDNYSKVEVIKTRSKWYGVTYKEDLIGVKGAIKKLIDEKIYNNNLWED